MLKFVLGNLIYLISFFSPKSLKIWVFGSWGGHSFADNPKYLYTHIKKNHPKIKAVWLTRNKAVVKSLRRKGCRAHLCDSLGGIWYSCRAGVGVISHGMIDINRFACARMKIVQTWHGTPMKPILLSDPKEETIRKRHKETWLSRVFFFLKKKLQFDKYLVVCSTSDYVSKILRRCFGEKVAVESTGYPRVDGLFSPQLESGVGFKITSFKKQGKGVGVYMPTYRREGEHDIVQTLLTSSSVIEKQLAANQQVLFVRIHPFDHYKVRNFQASKNIHFIENDDIDGDIYSVLGLFDFIISDYSSVVFDYLILARPIYLFTPDREQCVAGNGLFVYDYVETGLVAYKKSGTNYK